jgi:hypothetical protein
MVQYDSAQLAARCRRNGIRRLRLFGSRREVTTDLIRTSISLLSSNRRLATSSSFGQSTTSLRFLVGPSIS